MVLIGHIGFVLLYLFRINKSVSLYVLVVCLHLGAVITGFGDVGSWLYSGACTAELVDTAGLPPRWMARV